MKMCPKTYSSKEGTVQALKNVSLTIRSGEIYGIIGMSGAKEKVHWYDV